jgi:ribosomal protein S18 acetylase RimI-like enzyme
MRTNADRRDPSPTMTELGPVAFGKGLDALMDVYAAAMGVPAFQLPGRRAIMQTHAVNPAFRAIAVTAPPEGSTVSPETTGAPGYPGGEVIAFAYGFRGDRGQWWHDLVRSALMASYGPASATTWLNDSFEVAELHVRPEHQQRGIGRRLLLRLAGGRTESTAVLSTMDTESPARGLYRSLGFTDLLTGYRFGGASEDYAVMGAVLPLRGASPPGATPSSTRPPDARPPSPRY